MMRARRLLALAVAASAISALPAAEASAHPLGNFSINHQATVSISRDRVDVRYLLDQAEIPTFQERGLAQADVLRRKQREVARRLVVRVDGRRVTLAPTAPPRLTKPPGQGGLVTTRIELTLRAQARSARRVTVEDATFPGRVGWKAIVARPGSGTAVRSSAPAGDPTNGLRSYPEDLLKSPADLRSASFAVAPGAGTLQAPDGRRVAGGGGPAAGDALTRAFSDAAAGRGVLVLLLLTAFGWGALHALSPGHGKAMVAAYLVGTRGTARHAVGLGLTVTVTHTAGVFALGFVALALSQYVLPEQLYPWLNLASGVLVLAVGAGVLRARLRAARARGHSHDHHGHDHDHDDHPGHGHHHDHAHGHDHSRGHSHAPPDRITWRGLVAMGASAGLIPCPSALVVLLGAIAQQQIALGLLLIVAFSLGLAATLTTIGLAVVYASRALARVPRAGRVAAVLPAVSALMIAGVGVMLTLRALPGIA